MTKHIAVQATDLPVQVGTDYPPPHDTRCRERRRYRLGDAFGLSQFGANLLELPSGTWSSQRHAHERQDELVGPLLCLSDGNAPLMLGPGTIGVCLGNDRHEIPCARAKHPFELSVAPPAAKISSIRRVDEDYGTPGGQKRGEV